MTDVWVVYEESGEYSDYSMGILGVAASLDAGKALVARIEQETYERDLTQWEANRAKALADKRTAKAQLAYLDSKTPRVPKPLRWTKSKGEDIYRAENEPTNWWNACTYSIKKYPLLEE